MTDVQPGQTVYVTKYALTEGVIERQLICLDQDGWIQAKVPGAMNNWALYGRTNWAPTREEAAAQATAMRDRKIKSVEKQLAKLKAMTFD